MTAVDVLLPPVALTRRRSWGRELLRDPAAVVSMIVLVIVIVAAIFAPLLAPYSPTQLDVVARLTGPSARHWLGTDELGRDELSRLMYGARVSLVVASVSVAAAAVVGGFAGGFAALTRGWVEQSILRVTDVILGFPEVLTALVLIAMLGVSTTNLIVAIAISYVPRFVRITWGSALVIRGMAYVDAARISGTPWYRLLTRHLLANIMSDLIVQISLTLAGAVLVESSLSYLGLGVAPPAASWGAMINSAQTYTVQSAWVAVFPGLAILVTVIAFNMLGDSLARVLDPKTRQGS